jgi:hypothetical protein
MEQKENRTGRASQAAAAWLQRDGFLTVGRATLIWERLISPKVLP